jgi:UPF0176 protein
MTNIKILALYQFTYFENLLGLQKSLKSICENSAVLGSLLIAPEGINGTIAGDELGIASVLSFIESLPGCSELERKFSCADKMPFLKLRVRIKKEIVSMGQSHVKPGQKVGNYITALDWNDFISGDDVIVIDTRNDYEVAIGTFNGAVNPETKKFRDFPKWWKKNANKFIDKKIAMFCTGGIRCEKSTNYLLQQNQKNVFHLKGGILKYLETVKAEDSIWTGECFVFDQRVSLKHELKEGTYSLCFACRRPISEFDKLNCEYEEGVSCHNCFDQHSPKRKDGFRERQKQIKLKTQRKDDE